LKKMLLVFGLIAIVFLVMPSAMAKFSGQHQFINGSNMNCENCHTTISAELHSGDAHNWSGTTSACRVCHIPNNNDATKSLYNDYQSGNTSTYHAAAMVECLFCHGELNGTNTPQDNSHLIPGANITAEFEDSSGVEAHRPLYFRAKNASGLDTNDMLKGANEACIACHTYAANVTIIEPTRYLNITANASGCTNGWYPGYTGTPDPNCYSDGYSSNWNITFGVNQ